MSVMAVSKHLKETVGVTILVQFALHSATQSGVLGSGQVSSNEESEDPRQNGTNWTENISHESSDECSYERRNKGPLESDLAEQRNRDREGAVLLVAPPCQTTVTNRPFRDDLRRL